MKCLECGGRLTCYAGRSREDGVRVRYRRCKSGHRKVTWEMSKELVKPQKPLSGFSSSELLAELGLRLRRGA